MIKHKALARTIGIVIGFPALTTIAIAQETGTGSTSETRPVGLEEILVTAQRREERLQDIPIAASVLTGDDLAARGIVSLDDLQSHTPSLSIQKDAFLSFVNVRGVGIQVANPSTSSGVAFYTDGFFVPHETAIGDPYYDVARIEVLRGPQGTLVGQNSTGGAVMVVTNDPDLEEFSGKAELTLGDYDLKRTEGTVNLPVSETFGLRISMYGESRDSYFTNSDSTESSTPDFISQPGQYSSNGGRLKALWIPSESLEVKFKYEYDKNDSDGIPGVAFSQLDGGGDLYNINQNDPTRNDYEVWRAVTEINWDINSNLTLRSITGYQDQASYLQYDMDGTDLASVVGNHHFYEETILQEFNLISSYDGPLNWVIGAFYLWDKLPVELDVFNSAFSLDTSPVHKSMSLFGQADYEFNDQWKLTVGARMSWDEKEAEGTFTLGGVGTFPIDLSTDSSEPTGKIALNYFPTENSNVYASVSRGYKSGGLNDNSPAVQEFEPETILSYEAGYKGTFYDNRLRLSLAAFRYDYQDFQLAVFDSTTGTSPVENVDGIDYYGAETEIGLKLGNWDAGLSIGYLDSEIRDVTLIDNRPAIPVAYDIGGRSANYAPEMTYSLNAGYVHNISVGEIDFRISYSYTDEQYTSVFQQPVTDIIERHKLVDASITFTSNNGYYIKAYGKNLTDEIYRTGNLFNLQAMLNSPKQYGVKLGINF